jgi:hypothetical protein
VAEENDKSPKKQSVTHANATHAVVMTRGQKQFHRIGHVFTPEPVEIDLREAWPDEKARAGCVHSLVCEMSPGGALEVEFLRR